MASGLYTRGAGRDGSTLGSPALCQHPQVPPWHSNGSGCQGGHFSRGEHTINNALAQPGLC